MLKIICIVAVAMLYFSKVYGDMAAIVDRCCEKGTQWAQQDDRCDNYPTTVSGVEDRDQLVCRTILEVCCLKSKQEQMCARGKEDGKASNQCVVRDDQLGAVTYRECCHCCRMGLMARERGMQCEAPPIGNPCDLKFMECCTGITEQGPDSNGGNTNNTDVSDINECEVFGEGQLCSQQCINTIGSFRCACNPGYALAQDKRTCYRVSQTETCNDRNPCDQGCVDTSLGPVCTCRDGFTLLRDRTTCEDIDECRRGMDTCRADEVCVNTVGGFGCESRAAPMCQAGYMFNPDQGTCVPEGQVIRDCPRGYAFNTVTQTCEDIDECVVQKHNCYGEHQMCENRRGSFYCRCEEGFMQLDRSSDNCTDIDECARQMDNCPASQRCENTIGSYVCRRITGCGTGYTLNEATQTCVDQNECELNTHNCGLGYECYNTNGSFRCYPRACPEGSRFSASTGQCETVSCPSGLRPGKISSCEDINECEDVSICNAFQTCVNTYGSFYCRDAINCPSGLEMDPATGQQCIDIDECARNLHKCGRNQTCINRRGSYVCTCPDGYRARGDGPCEDIDECQYGLVCPFNSKCVNTLGSYDCVCNDGLRLENRQCIDIDECQDPNLCQHRCVNMVGSYRCVCDRGYQLAEDGRSCEDVNECQQFGTICAGTCTNVPGSYRCTCPEGWRIMGNGRSCQDVNECETGLARCGTNPDTMCFNTRGSYKCPTITCPNSFIRSEMGPSSNSVRCKRLSFTCQRGDVECLTAPLSISYNFLSFPPNVKIPTDLFSMSGPQTTEKIFNWDLEVVSAVPLRTGVMPVTRGHFDLTIRRNDAIVSLMREIDGPQDIELKLKMSITDRFQSYTGTAISNIYLYVTSRNIE